METEGHGTTVSYLNPVFIGSWFSLSNFSSPHLLAYNIFLLQRSQTCSTIIYEKKIRKRSFWEVASNTDKWLVSIQTSERALCTTSNMGGHFSICSKKSQGSYGEGEGWRGHLPLSNYSTHGFESYKGFKWKEKLLSKYKTQLPFPIY